MNITANTSLRDLAFFVCQHLADSGIEAVLTGGAVVTIYTECRYQSLDLDFISSTELSRITEAMAEIGFHEKSGRHYVHDETEFFVEFLPPPLALGNTLVSSWDTIVSELGTLFLLSPTQSVMDRLAAYYHWNDFEGLNQAVLIAEKQAIDIQEIERWSASENNMEKFSRAVLK